jgi:hypothetical protein
MITASTNGFTLHQKNLRDNALKWMRILLVVVVVVVVVIIIIIIYY